MFELKEEYLKEYCTYFYHFSKADQSKAEETQRKLRKDMPLDLSGIFSLIIDFVLNYFRLFFLACPPPILPPFTKNFKPVLNILKCSGMLQIMTIVLERCAAKDRLCTENQIHRVNLLDMLGLNPGSSRPGIAELLAKQLKVS